MNRRARLGLGCSLVLLANLAAATAWALWERSVRVDRRPVLVGNRLVSPRTGEVLKTFDADGWGTPDSTRPGIFHLDGLLVDAETLSASKEPDLGGPWFRTLEDTAVGCVDSGEHVLWRKELPKPPSRDHGPDYEVTRRGSLIFVGSAAALWVLDRADGHEIWHTAGGGLGCCVSGDLVLSHADGPLVLGRALATGAEVLRYVEPGPVARIETQRGLFLVCGGMGTPFTRLHDHGGTVLAQVPSSAACWDVTDQGVFVVSEEGVELYGFPGASLRWRNLDFKESYPWTVNWSSVLLEGGDLVAMSDNRGNLDLLRIEGSTGKTLWLSRCTAAEVEPGNGYSHEVYAEARGDHLVVVNQSWHAGYVAVLDLATGEQRRRFNYPPR
jgi:hypothetical protein